MDQGKLCFRHELHGKVSGVYAGICAAEQREGVVDIIPSLRVRLDRDSDGSDRLPMYMYMGIWVQQLGRCVENPTPDELNHPILATVGLPPIDQLVGRTLAVQTPDGEVAFRIGGVMVFPGDDPVLLVFKQVESWEDKGRSVRIRMPNHSRLLIPDVPETRIADSSIRLLD